MILDVPMLRGKTMPMEVEYGITTDRGQVEVYYVDVRFINDKPNKSRMYLVDRDKLEDVVLKDFEREIDELKYEYQYGQV